jgi:four helix bundle protein
VWQELRGFEDPLTVALGIRVDRDLVYLVHCADRMNPKALQLQERTQRFASLVIAFCETLSRDPACRQIVDQLTDAAGATDSNYRATCRARSPDEFIATVGVAAEEADETKGWLELLVRTGFASEASARALIQEADELTAIFVASRKTAKRRREQREQLNQQLRTAKRSRRRS